MVSRDSNQNCRIPAEITLTLLKKIALVLVLGIVLAAGYFYVLGSGMSGDPWLSEPVAAGPRESTTNTAVVATPSATDQTLQILFGDLHTHTNYSIDAYLFNTKLVKGLGRLTPADACDFARYCSALDFWSINDHAESLSPRAWADTVDAIRQCNAEAGDPVNPDMVSFVGWEWSQGSKDNLSSHYGHKNVIFRRWEEGATPTRPISSEAKSIWQKFPSILIGLISLTEDSDVVADLGWYMRESRDTPICPTDSHAKELPTGCRDVALTPSVLYRKLDEWGYDSMVIPHGLAWGITNPLTADFRDQLEGYENRYEKLIETFSGHGNSEMYEKFQRIGQRDNGDLFCPPATENFTPCCHQAGEITRDRCDEPDSVSCDAAVETAIAAFVEKGVPAGRKTIADASLDDWAGCGQLHNVFQPASMYVPRQSTQYNLALGFDNNGNPKRARFGLIGSSDNHVARPGNSYKESNRVLYTDNKNIGKAPVIQISADEESAGFYYTGGLVAVHSAGRDRDAIWDGLNQRQVYATSGDRMLVWFDLLNGPTGESPMGSEVSMVENPRFRVSAIGAMEQSPGCPDHAVAALGQDRIDWLCGGECYQPANQRRAISRVEIVRIRPQVSPDEKIQPLVESPWQVFDCPADDSVCTVEFDDPEFIGSERPALYYARVIQEADELISGDPFGCEYNADGECVKRNYCIGENATPDNNCESVAAPRAWTSPIYIDYPNDVADRNSG